MLQEVQYQEIVRISIECETALLPRCARDDRVPLGAIRKSRRNGLIVGEDVPRLGPIARSRGAEDA